MYKIGEFSKLCGLSPSTLRDYEQRRIFLPASVDKWTGYRYYDGAQLAALSKILALRDTGLSLDEIAGQNLHQTDVHQLIETLEKKAQAMVAAGPAFTSRLERLRTHIILIKNGGIPSSDSISVKRVEPIRVASIRRTVPKSDFAKNLEDMWMAVRAAIPKRGPKRNAPLMTLWHSGFDDMKRLSLHHGNGMLDMEVAEPVLPFIEGNGEIHVNPLPMVTKMACVVHRGPISSIDNALHKLNEWMARNQWQAVGPLRNIYHRGVWNTHNPEEHITELQYPLQ